MAGNKFNAKLGLDTKEFDDKLKGSEKKVSGFSSGLKTLAAGMAAAFSVGVLINFGKQAIKLASQVEGVKTAFIRLGAPGLLTGLRTATRGTVTDLQLMQKAVQANNFKIPLSQLASYFEFATKRSIQTGESVDYLVDSIVTGIGRKSVLVMDNLGISAVELQKQIAISGDFATAAAVIIERELTSMGDVADTTAIKIASIGTAFENLKTGLGIKITETPFFQGLTNWINNIGKFAQTPGVSLVDAIYGATFKADEFNEILDDSNKLIAENANAILKQKEAKELSRKADLLALTKKNDTISKVGTSHLNIGSFSSPIDSALAGVPDTTPLTEGLTETQQALIGLSDQFAGFFSDVNLGFEGMIKGVITGIKRLVMELIAKAAFLAILSAIFPAAGVALNIGTILGGNGAKLLQSKSSGKLTSGAASATSVGSQQLVASISGKNLTFLMNNRS